MRNITVGTKLYWRPKRFPDLLRRECESRGRKPKNAVGTVVDYAIASGGHCCLSVVFKGLSTFTFLVREKETIIIKPTMAEMLHNRYNRATIAHMLTQDYYEDETHEDDALCPRWKSHGLPCKSCLQKALEMHDAKESVAA